MTPLEAMVSSRQAILGMLLWLFAPAAGAQTLLFTEPGDAAGDGAGSAVAVVGDVDADGADDFAIGSPFDDVAGSNAGMARVYSGRTRQPIFTWRGSSAGDQFGRAVAGVGDLDGDGHADLVVGAPFGEYADVLSGATGLQLFRLTGLTGRFGWAVAGGGEVDGDGVPDILVGAPFHFTAVPGQQGALQIFSGATGASIRSHVGLFCLNHFGWSAAFYGDVDGDGYTEYAVGQPNNQGCGDPQVHAYDGASGALLWTHTAPQLYDQLGFSVAPLADVTGDGIPEVLAGAPQDPGVGCGPCNGVGYVRLLDGATGNQVWQADGGGVGWYTGLGFALTGIGDVDGDGYEDFAASQPSTEGCNGNTNALHVRDGQTGALLLQIPRPSPGDNFGYSLASGDANADGLRDLLVGTPCDDANGTDSGATYAYTIVLDEFVYCWAKVNSQGCTPSIYSAGSPSLAMSTLRVNALDVINNKSGILFWGRRPSALPFQGGYLCAQSSVVRTPIQSSGGNPPPNDCSGSYSFHFTSAYMSAQGMQPGDQIYCQYWSRDPMDPWATGLTDALAFRALP